jgi:ABC-2 type transport system ATP-binding protein
MDEAERCHRLAYIAYGSLLTHGAVADVVRAAGLTTWAVTGDNLYPLAEKLRRLPGIDEVVAFGNTLHISGRNAEQLQASITPFMSGYRWEPIASGLEDVFISLMETAKDNFS